MRRQSLLATSLLLACLLSPRTAGAGPLPSWLDPFARLEAGAAVPLRAPQTDYFTPGFGGKLSLGLAFGGVFGVQLSGLPVVLPPRDTAPTNQPGVPLGVGGGVRFQLPYQFSAMPWIDGDALYVRTGSYDRFGFAVGVGLDFALGASRAVRLGPFARFVDVLDRDRDGTADGDDRCPDQEGLPANFGCPDTDRDGIVDALDKCIETPGPAFTFGCPDTDKDGVIDRDDRCPRHPGLARFAGCPDRDGDEIADLDDQCPTQAGPVRSGGCPDRDGDTVGDIKDKCPDVAGSPAAGGCPDGDKDTVADNLDRCPAVPGSVLAGGCPDGDGDGVDDGRDRCPGVKGRVVTEGCPDGDEDGVADADDLCPRLAGSMLARGCPDRDGDKVADAEDQCPDVKGPADNAGCPQLSRLADAVAKSSLVGDGKAGGGELEERVYFDYKSAELGGTGDRALAAILQLLARYPEVRLLVEGHADDRGSDRYNVVLSRDRANTVRGFLLARGVAPERLQARGWGAKHPAVSEHTPEARDKNRRVEFVLVR